MIKTNQVQNLSKYGIHRGMEMESTTCHSNRKLNMGLNMECTEAWRWERNYMP